MHWRGQARPAGLLRHQLQITRQRLKCVSVILASRILFSPQIDDVEYEDDTPDDVSADSAWGYCDSKCHVSVRDLGATVLQEVRFGEWTFSLTTFIVRSNYLH